ncbi:MAG: hypothetical protein CR997_04405 [Acidobacteria bacterium]|nr:MAG: hypothetical protein CR997_04405 [Acidobacteriota bacterium]
MIVDKKMNCPICRESASFWRTLSDRTYEVTRFEASYYRCPSCHVVFMHPVPERSEIERFYPTGYWQEGSSDAFLTRVERFYSRTMLRLDLLAWLKKASRGMPSHLSYLDIGCSRGELLLDASKLGFHVTGLEGDSRAVQFARDQYGLDIIHGDVETWRPRSSYHLISAFHVLEHLRDPAAFLRQLHGCLHSQGRLLLRVPNIDSWQAQVMKEKWKGLEAPRHLSHFSPRGLVRLLTNSGYKLLVQSTWSLRDGPPALTSSLCMSGEPTYQAITGKKSLFLKLFYLQLNWALTPIELIASLFGQGGMITIIAEKQSCSNTDRDVDFDLMTMNETVQKNSAEKNTGEK